MKKPSSPFPLLFFALIFTSLFGQNNQFDIFRLQNSYDLNDRLFILPLEADTLLVNELQDPSWNGRFVHFQAWLKNNYPDAKHPVKLDARETYWCRVVLNNHLPENTPLQNWILFTGKSNVTEVWLVHSDGRVEGPKHTGLTVPANRKDFIFGNQEHERVQLSLPPDDYVTLFIKVKTPNLRKPWIDVCLTAEDYFHSWDFIIKTRKDWLFIGFLLTFSLINLILFLGTKDRAFLYHFLFQVGIFVYLLEFFSLLYDIVWFRDHPLFVQTVIYFSLCGMDMAYLQFIRTYMHLRKDFPGWDAVFKILLITRFVLAAGVVALFYTTNNMPLADNITAVYMILQYVGAGIFLMVFSQKDFKSMFLLVGTFLFILGVALNGWSVIIGTGLRFGYTQVGVVGEVLLFTLGLGYRMKILIQEQRDTQRLRDLDDFKTKFYTNITHEFRTPLTVIQGMAGQLRLEFNQPGQQEKLDLLTSNGDYLLHLVNRMLALAKLQSGKTELNLHRGDIIEFLCYLAFSFQDFALGKDIHIRFLTELEKFEMDFDAEKLQDVMTNLVSNAIKFTQRGGTITVLTKVARTADGQEQLLIQVKDSGIGMSPQDLKHLFERFYQGSAVKQEGQGSGLGLAITKELIKLMQGTIEVESEGGAGSTFTISLAVSRSASVATTQTHPPIQMDIRGEPENPTVEGATFDGGKPLVLVVEDNYDMVQFLKSLLENDYYVATAKNGNDGIKQAIELVPDIIISDIMMPGTDGLELCRTLKADQRTSHIPILLTTAKASEQDQLSGLESGADAYLVKPFRKEELFLSLRNFLLARQHFQEYFYKKMAGGEPGPDDATQAENAFISQVRQIIEANMEDEYFGVVQLCHKLGMSRSQLHRKITSLAGTSTSHLINNIRLAHAKKLLTTSNLNVSEIAYRTGLEPNYFSRMFKESTGLTPSEFREQKPT